MIKKICVYDMDGTIVDSTHRYAVKEGKIDLEHWIKHDKPEFILKDECLPLADRYRHDLQNHEVFVIIATARACIKGDANYRYIDSVLGMPDRFIHRQGRKDHRGGAALKLAAIKPLLNLKQFKSAVIHIYEDNINYLHDLCVGLNSNHLTVGHFNPSMQGH